jgi:hypothetical protein
LQEIPFAYLQTNTKDIKLSKKGSYSYFQLINLRIIIKGNSRNGYLGGVFVASNNIREQQLLDEIEEWQKSYLYRDEALQDINYEQWITKLMNQVSPDLRDQYIEKVDTILFHLSTFLQSSNFLLESRSRIIQEAKALNGEIEQIADLRTCSIDQLIHLSNHQVAKHRLLSLVQGGMSGSGSHLLTGIDVPASVLLQLYSVQRVAMCYGYDTSEPYELLVALKVFNLTTLSRSSKQENWKELEVEVFGGKRFHPYFFESNENFLKLKWDQFVFKQLSKVLLLYYVKKKFKRKLPILGILFGGLSNYRMTREITEVANNFYRKRNLNERLNSE